jgi:regulator of sigma E protease
VRLEAVIGADMLVDRFGNQMERGLLGMAGVRPVIEPVSPLRAIPVAVRQTGEIVRMTVETLGQVITGRRSVKDMRGRLAWPRPRASSDAGLGAFAFLVALVSINLGFHQPAANRRWMAGTSCSMDRGGTPAAGWAGGAGTGPIAAGWRRWRR